MLICDAIKLCGPAMNQDGKLESKMVPVLFKVRQDQFCNFVQNTNQLTSCHHQKAVEEHSLILFCNTRIQTVEDTTYVELVTHQSLCRTESILLIHVALAQR